MARSFLSSTFLAVLAVSSASLQLSAADNAFRQTNLVANSPAFNPTIMVDPHLLNPWGIALRPPGAGGHIWISNSADGSTTTYIGDVNGITLHQDGLKVIPMDNPSFTDHGYSRVTGQVYNAASDIPGQPVEFPVSGPANNWSTEPPTPLGIISGPAKFVFVTKDGTINAWRSSTNPGMLSAVIIKDYSMTSATPLHGLAVAPVYTGVAMTTDAYTVDGSGNSVAKNRLYATDFANSRIQVFDNQWNDVTASVPFERPAGIPADFGPFNIQYLNGKLYVTYAQLNTAGEEAGEEIDGPGGGRLYAYDRDGHIIQEFPDYSALNAPWGLAIAPASFGAFGGDLLVANFGDGRISAYDLSSGALMGMLRDPNGEIISIDGLWGLTFGNGVSLGDASALYFTAGPNSEQDGIFGKLEATTASAAPSFASLDRSFESVSAGANSYFSFVSGPSLRGWTFAGSAGISGNNSGYTSGNPGAPDGAQVAFIQSQGSLTARVQISAGTYTVSALIANRANWGASQTVIVTVDDQPVGSFQAGPNYVLASTSAFTVGDGTHTIAFLGQSTADATLFLDQVALQPAGSFSTVSVGNSGFETPNVGANNYYAFQAGPATVPGVQDWIFQGGAGITGNNSGYTSGNPAAPEGSQVAFLQTDNAILSQTLLVPTSGTYQLSVSAAQRGNWNEAEQVVQVWLDNATFLGTIQPHSPNYQVFTFPVVAGQGSHVLTFKGTTRADSTLLLDNVSITGF